jgi:hypothetical protein
MKRAAVTAVRRLCRAFPLIRRRPDAEAASINTDAVKTTALDGAGTLRPVRTAAADAAHRTSILESNARNSQRSLRDRCRPRCYGPSIRQR